jgi:ankyrin repeat protein
MSSGLHPYLRGVPFNLIGWLLIAPTLLIVGGVIILSTGGLKSPIIHWFQLEGQRRSALDSIDANTRYDPIQDAVKAGDLEAVRARLRQDPSSMKARDPFGWTPLHLATWNHNEIAALLLEHGAKLEEQDRGGLAPLALAARNGNDDSVRFLIEHGANIRAEDFSGRTPLHYAAQYGHAGSATLLLDHGAPVDIRDGHAMTPLMQASMWGREEVVRLLLSRGANVNAREAGDWTPLHRAVSGGLAKPNPAVVKHLLEHGADPRAKDDQGNTPLMFAVSQNDPEIVRMLLDRGADPRIRNSSGNSPLWAAIIVPDAAQRENANTNFIAAGDHYAEIVELLLDHGADANLISRDQGAPLHQAARAGGVELTRVLLAHGARAEIQGDDRGTTPLMLAAENAHPEIVKLLLAAGANANHRDTNGYTSLMHDWTVRSIRPGLRHPVARRSKKDPVRAPLARCRRRPESSRHLPQYGPALRCKERIVYDHTAAHRSQSRHQRARRRKRNSSPARGRFRSSRVR